MKKLWFKILEKLFREYVSKIANSVYTEQKKLEDESKKADLEKMVEAVKELPKKKTQKKKKAKK